MGTTRRVASMGLVLSAASVCGAFGAVVPAGRAEASTNLPVHYTVHASTTLAKLHQTVTVPPGTFTGTINLGTGVLEGNLALPPATTTVGLAGVGLANATFQLAPTRPVRATVDFSTLVVTATASFNVLVTSVEPLGLLVNLVGTSCGTSRPVSVTFSGKLSFTGASTFSGVYRIPSLDECGLLTPVLNLLIPGPGNQFTASFAPGG
jgi:hypothetical protein